MIVGEGRKELANDLAKVYLNKGNSLDNLGNLRKAVDIYGDAINLWEDSRKIHDLPNLIKAFRIRVGILIEIEDWETIGIDVGKAFTLGLLALASEDFSDHFKQLIYQEFGWILKALCEVLPTSREGIYKNAGEMGDVIRQYVDDFEK